MLPLVRLLQVLGRFVLCSLRIVASALCQLVLIDRALALAKTAHDLAPSSPAVMDTLGMVYMARREYSASVEALEKARRLLAQSAPSDSEGRQLQAAIQQHLALAYLRSGEPESAARVVPLAR